MEFLLIIFLVIGLCIYFLPAAIGWNKRNSSAILALNFFLGWTLIGWVIALVWALSKDSTPIIISNQKRKKKKKKRKNKLNNKTENTGNNSSEKIWDFKDDNSNHK